MARCGRGRVIAHPAPGTFFSAQVKLTMRAGLIPGRPLVPAPASETLTESGHSGSPGPAGCQQGSIEQPLLPGLIQFVLQPHPRSSPGFLENELASGC